MLLRLLTALCFLLFQSVAAENELAGPVLGFVYDPANGLQPVLGVAGASTIGPPLELTGNFSKAVISPRQDYALAVSASNPNLMRVMIGDPVSVEQFGIPISATGLIALSPTGSSAAFQDRDRNRIQVIAGIPSAPSLAREFDLSPFPGALVSLAVSDDASVVIAGFSDVEENAVAALGLEGLVRFLTPRRATAAAFLPGVRDVVIADGPANEIYLIRDALGSGESKLLAAQDQGISEPTAVVISRDGKRAVVASGSALSVALIDLAGGAVSAIPCPCNPSELATLNGNAVFRLTPPAAGPMWVLDADALEPRIVFVPPYQPVIEESAR